MSNLFSPQNLLRTKTKRVISDVVWKIDSLPKRDFPKNGSLAEGDYVIAHAHGSHGLLGRPLVFEPDKRRQEPK